MDRMLDILITIKGARAVKDVKNVQTALDKAKGSARDFGRSVKGAENKIHQFRVSTSAARRTIGAIRNELLVLAFAFGGVAKAISNSIRAFKEYQSSMVGLSEVGKAVGLAQNEVQEAAIGLAKDGLLTVSEAAAGLKNLLSTKNYTLEQSINLMNAFRDSAAFNRQGTLEFGQSIIGATQGLKNMLSILVDNAGITKNLSVLEKEYAASIGTTVGRLTEAERRQAHYVGILREAEIFTGNAAKVTETYSGKMSQLNVTAQLMKISLGEVFTQGLKPIIGALRESFIEIRKNIDANKELIKLKVGEFFRKAYDATKLFVSTTSGLIKILWELRDVIKAILVVWAGGKIFTLGSGIFTKLSVGVGASVKSFKHYLQVSNAVAAAQASMSGTLLLTTTRISKATIVLNAFKAAFITTKVAILGVVGVLGLFAYAIYRMATADERARRKKVELITTQIDEKNKIIDADKARKRSIKSQISEIEQMKKTGELTDALRKKLESLREEYERLEIAIAKSGKEVFLQDLKRNVVSMGDFSRETRAFKEEIEKIAPSVDTNRKEFIQLEEALTKIRDKYKEMSEFEITGTTQIQARGPMGRPQFTTMTKEIKERVRAIRENSDAMNTYLTLLRNYIADTSKAGSTTDDLTTKTDALSKAYLRLQQRVRSLIQSMTVDILKFKGMELEASKKQLEFEVANRKALIEQLNKNDKLRSEALIKLKEWEVKSILDIETKAMEKRQALLQKTWDNEAKASRKKIDDLADMYERMGDVEARTGLFGLQGAKRDEIELLDRVTKLREEVKKIEDESLTKGVEDQLIVANWAADQMVLIKDYEEIRKFQIQKAWMFKASEAAIQASQELGQALGYMWFQNETDTQNEIKKIRENYRLGHIKSEEEMQKRIAIARRNAEIRSANVTLQLYQSVVNTVGQMFMAMIQRQLMIAKTTSALIKSTLFGIGVGVATTLLTAFIGSKQKQEEQFIADATTSLEKERRTSFGRLSVPPVQNISIVPTVTISGEIVNIGAGGDISSFETGMENLIKKTIQDSIDTGELDFGNLLTSGATG